MNDETGDDLPTEVTRLLRNVPGVHTVYATKPLISAFFTAAVEALRNDPVGMHLVTANESDEGSEILACIGVTGDESASTVCRRAHDALRSYFTNRGDMAPRNIRVSIGRVG